MAKSGGTFKKGNKAAVGNSGPPPRHKLITQVIISQLNEVDKATTRERVHQLVDGLMELAMGHKIAVKTKGGKIRVYDRSPDLPAIKEITDRVEGKAPQSVEIAGPGGGSIGIELIRRVIVDPKKSDKKD